MNPSPCGSYFSSEANWWLSLYRRRSFQDRLGLFIGQVRKHTDAGMRILDFGCGPGVMALALADMGYAVTGLDTAEGMIRLADEERCRRGIDNASFHLLRGSPTGPMSEPYDVVICSSVLEYVQNDKQLVHDLCDLLKPGGLLVISVPHSESILGKLEDLAREFGWTRCGARGQWLRYLRRRYGRDELHALLRRNALEPLEWTYFESPWLAPGCRWLSRVRFIAKMLLVSARKRSGLARDGGLGSCERKRYARAVCAFSRKNIWAAMPASVRASVGRLLSAIPTKYILGPRFGRTSSFLDTAQWWPAEKARAYELQILRKVLRGAMRRSAYYYRIFRTIGFKPEDVRTCEDLRQLPCIDRGTVNDCLQEMIAGEIDGSTTDAVFTGGTSGRPLRLYMGKDRSELEYAYLVAGWQRAGYRLGMQMAVFRGQVVSGGPDELGHEYDGILRRHYYSSFHMTDADMRRYLSHIAEIGPCYLLVYPSLAAALARFAERCGVPPPRNIRGVLAGSENVYPEQRKMVERVFGVPYFSWYGHTEKLVMAAECEHSTDYHVWPTYGYFELLDEEGDAVTTPGRRGEIVGTAFINTVTPLIRYRTGDYATYVGSRCEACGREHIIIKDIRGHRTQEVLFAGDGSEISWTALNMHDDTFDRVRQFQFYQDEPGKAVLRVVAADGFNDRDVVRIRRRMAQKLNGRVAFEIRLVEGIDLSPRGKAIYVDQRIPSAAGPGA